MPCPSKVKAEIAKEGSFSIDRLEVSEVNWNAYDTGFITSNALNDGGYSVAKRIRAVAEPLLSIHFGEGIIDEVFRRYREIVADCMSKEKIEFIDVTVSITKTSA